MQDHQRAIICGVGVIIGSGVGILLIAPAFWWLGALAGFAGAVFLITKNS